MLTTERYIDNSSHTHSIPLRYAYASAGGNFVYYFLGDNQSGLSELRDALADDSTNYNRLQRVSAQLHRQALPQSRIDLCINNNPEIIKAMYD